MDRAKIKFKLNMDRYQTQLQHSGYKNYVDSSYVNGSQQSRLSKAYDDIPLLKKKWARPPLRLSASKPVKNIISTFEMSDIECSKLSDLPPCLKSRSPSRLKPQQKFQQQNTSVSISRDQEIVRDYFPSSQKVPSFTNLSRVVSRSFMSNNFRKSQSRQHRQGSVQNQPSTQTKTRATYHEMMLDRLNKQQPQTSQDLQDSKRRFITFEQRPQQQRSPSKLLGQQQRQKRSSYENHESIREIDDSRTVQETNMSKEQSGSSNFKKRKVSPRLLQLIPNSSAQKCKLVDSRKVIRIKKNLLKALESEEIQDRVLEIMTGKLQMSDLKRPTTHSLLSNEFQTSLCRSSLQQSSVKKRPSTRDPVSSNKRVIRHLPSLYDEDGSYLPQKMAVQTLTQIECGDKCKTII